MAILQSILVFYACSRGFGTSITLLDEDRLNQIQAVSKLIYSEIFIQEANRSVACNKRYLRFDNYLPLEMLRRRYLPSTHSAKTAQQSFLGYIGSLHSLANSSCVYRIGELRAEQAMEIARGTMS